MSASPSTRVAVAQMRSGSDVVDNRASISALIVQAAEAGAQLVSLPEYATYLGPSSRLGEVAESVENGPTTDLVRHLATRLKISVIVGSLVELSADGIYNTSVFIDNDGNVAGKYRKVHLFTSTLPTAAASESDGITPGSELTVVDWHGWRVGLSICFDLRFPELYRELSSLHADVLSIPAAFTTVTGRDHWEVLLRARAIENQAYVIAPAQIGKFDGGESFGRSAIVDPWGTVSAVVGDTDGTGIATAELTHERVAQVRTQLPALANRRFGRSALGSAPLSTARIAAVREKVNPCVVC